MLLEYDLRARKITRTLKVNNRGGDLVIAGFTAYTSDVDAVYRIDLLSFRSKTIVTGLASDWFGGGSKLNIDPSHRWLYGIKGRNLVQIAISPTADRNPHPGPCRRAALGVQRGRHPRSTPQHEGAR